MLVIVFIICLLLMYIGYYITRSAFSPMVLISGVWGVVIASYFVFEDAFFPIMHIFPLAILLWIVCFWGAAFYAGVKSVPFYLAKEREGKPNASILKIYYAIVCIAIPIFSIVVLYNALKGPTDNLLFNLRELNVAGFGVGILGYFISLTLVLYLIELVNYSHANKKRVYILLFLNLLIATITVSKLSFLAILFSSIVVLYYKKKIKFKTIILLFLGFFVFAVLLQSLRSQPGSLFKLKEFLAIYVAAGSVAFDYFIDTFNSPAVGANTFRFFYAVARFLGNNVEVNQTILTYASTPLPTNVYTVLFPFYTDFGWCGIIVLGVFMGYFYGFIHGKVRTGEPFFLVIYAIFSVYIIMQFMGEFIFTNMSITIQYLFYALLPYIVKREIKIIW